MRTALHALALLLCGAGYALAFPPVGAWPLGVAGVAGLFFAWAVARSPERAAAAGVLFWLTVASFQVAWMAAGLDEVSQQIHFAGAIASTLLFCAWLCLFPCLAGAVTVALAGDSALRRCLAAPAAFALAEWARSEWWDWGNGWFAFGYALLDSPFAGWMPLAGVHAATFWACASASALAGIVCVMTRRGAGAVSARREAAFVQRVAQVAVLLAIAALPAAGGALLRKAEFTEPAGRELRVALLQPGSLVTDAEDAKVAARKALQLYARMLNEVRADLVLLPEAALDAAIQDAPPEEVRALRDQVHWLGGELVLGAAFRTREGDVYNAALRLDENDWFPYFKIRLVPGGEYLPGALSWLQALGMAEGRRQGGSELQGPMPVAGEQLALTICYEDGFPGLVRRVLPQATLIVNLSNFSIFPGEAAHLNQLQMTRARALENGRPALRVGIDGVTAAIDHRGRVEAALPLDAQQVLEVVVRGRSGSTPWIRWGHGPLVGLCLLLLAVTALAARRTR